MLWEHRRQLTIKDIDQQFLERVLDEGRTIFGSDKKRAAQFYTPLGYFKQAT